MAARASFSATSTASEPPVVNSTFDSSPGAISASFAASAVAGSFAKRRGAKGRRSICAAMAAFTRGWP